MSTADHTALTAYHHWLSASWEARGLVLVLTGAGISAESGIPTFRGEEGYWRIGSRNYFPHELATRAAFEQMPDAIWGWYLYRRSHCRAAEPNAAHDALVRLERALATDPQCDFLLVTQNVDGLHLRAGSAPERTFEIHGNLNYMRSVSGRDSNLYAIPEPFDAPWESGRVPTAAESSQLACPDGSRARPHVLWFDESYDEARYRYRSTLAAVERATLVIVIGTAGATALPAAIVERTVERGTPLLVVNRDPSPFSAQALRTPRGFFLQGSASKLVPAIVDSLIHSIRAED